MPEAKKKRFPIDMDFVLLLCIMAAILLFMWAKLGSDFYNIRNISSMVSQLPEFAFLAMGMALAMISGGIDLSVVAIMNLSGIILAMSMTNSSLTGSVGVTGAIIIGVVGALIVGLLCGTVNGVAINKFGIPPIIATLGSMLFFSGLGVGITNGEGITGLPEQFTRLINMTVLELPPPFFLMLIFFALLGFFTSRLVVGKSLYLYGSSRIAALFSGLKIGKTVIWAYAASGFLAAISAMILVGRSNSIKVGYGDTYQLQAILVVVLAGVNPDGGKGKFSNILVAVLILQVLQNAFTLFAYTPYAKKLIWGGMLLAFMVIRTLVNKWRERSKVKARLALANAKAS